MISRRTLLTLPIAAACSSGRRAGFHGYAFTANEEGHAVAAVDLEALAVARHIPLDAAPVQVLALRSRPLVFALTAETGSVHEIHVDRLRYSRKIAVAQTAVTMRIADNERALYVLGKQPRSLVRIALDSWTEDWRVTLPDEPVDFELSPGGKFAGVSSAGSVRLVDLASGHASDPLAGADSKMGGDFGAVMFRKDGRLLIAADRGERRLSLYDVAEGRLVTHLPLAVRPDNLCVNQDGGQLFVTGEGMDAVVIVYPFHSEVGETVLAGHAPGPMAASTSFLFLASPQFGDVSILNIGNRKVIGSVTVGSDPGCIAITPDDQFALVLNRKSGDVAVIRVGGITGTERARRFKMASLLTVIPVGSRPVSAAFRGV
ncbi:MAG TPA: YncE family protein [Bryobacteraceae bacterium]|nr:YncE family protein [Bryobacteraceae bacterium]